MSVIPLSRVCSFIIDYSYHILIVENAHSGFTAPVIRPSFALQFRHNNAKVGTDYRHPGAIIFAQCVVPSEDRLFQDGLDTVEWSFPIRHLVGVWDRSGMSPHVRRLR